MSDFKPIRMLEVELSGPLPSFEPLEPLEGGTYGSGYCLVRLHDAPIGMVDVDLDSGGRVPADALAETIWRELGGHIERHLREDGLPAAGALTAAGLPVEGQPRCVSERDAFLERAPFLTVIVPSRDRPDRLRTCLDSILATEYPAERYEILVVDNAPSTDGTLRLIEDEYGDRGVRYLREDRPGSASARNAGLKVVDSDIVVFTDDDVRVDRHWLTETARGFEAAPDVTTVSGLLLPMELETPAQVWFEEYGGFSRGFDRRVYDLGENRPSDLPLYPFSAGVFGTGNNFAFRRGALAAIGDFDPALGNGTPALGGVDSEVLLRTIVTGHRIVYEPASIVHHAHRRDYEALQRQVYSYGVGLTAYLLKTMLHYPRLLPDFLGRVPRGLMFALNPSSSKNANKREDYPSELTWLELRGMVYGPLAYARSRRKFGPHDVSADKVPARRTRS